MVEAKDIGECKGHDNYIIRYYIFNRIFEIVDANKNIGALSIMFLGLTEQAMINYYELDKDFYRAKMVGFGGCLYKRAEYVETIFHNIDDCERAKEWLESFVIMDNISSS